MNTVNAATDGQAYTVLLLILYFFPTMLAGRKHPQKGAIFALNLLLGWTVLGWIVACVWAVTKQSKPQPAPAYYREIAPGQFVPVHEIDTTKGGEVKCQRPST